MRTYKLGDIVTREKYMDDGTWGRLGDSCLPGPLKIGKVIKISTRENEIIYTVRWDDRTEGRYFPWGISSKEV